MPPRPEARINQHMSYSTFRDRIKRSKLNITKGYKLTDCCKDCATFDHVFQKSVEELLRTTETVFSGLMPNYFDGFQDILLQNDLDLQSTKRSESTTYLKLFCKYVQEHNKDGISEEDAKKLQEQEDIVCEKIIGADGLVTQLEDYQWRFFLRDSLQTQLIDHMLNPALTEVYMQFDYEDLDDA